MTALDDAVRYGGKMQDEVIDYRFTYFGTNHIGWFQEIKRGEHDALEDYRTALKSSAEQGFPSSELIGSLRALPLKYLALVYERNAILHRQRIGTSRSDELERLSATAYASFAGNDLNASLHALDSRSTPWYEYAVGPFIAAHAEREASATTFFLTTENQGYMREFSANEVMEIPHRFTKNSGCVVIPPSSNHADDILVETLRAYLAYERMAAEVIFSRDEAAIASALAHHPWLFANDDIADVLAVRILDHNRKNDAAQPSISATLR